MRPLARRLEITILSFTMALPGPLSQHKRYKTLYITQTRRGDLLLTSTIDPLFSFSLSMVGGYFSLDNFNILCLWSNWHCANKRHVSFALPKQMLTQDKIFTIVSSAAFVHTHRYNQGTLRSNVGGIRL